MVKERRERGRERERERAREGGREGERERGAVILFRGQLTQEFPDPLPAEFRSWYRHQILRQPFLPA